MVYGSEQEVEAGDDAGTTARVNPVWEAGNLGGGPQAGVKPVQWANGGVADTNPYLHNATHPVILLECHQ